MTSNQHKLFLLPGDGIGVEVIEATRTLLDPVANKFDLAFELDEGLVGGASIDAHGLPLTEETLAKAKASDAVLFGAIGGPKWDGSAYDKRPEAGLLNLRKGLEAFANLRPAICFDALADASSLKPELVAGLDILIVRELTGGVYFGEPRGISDLPGGGRVGVNTQRYTDMEIRRIARVGFEMAEKRGGRIASAEKSNVMESGLLWREEVTKLHQEEYGHLQLEHILADNCAMQLVKAPKQFDVIVTDNLFGDLLSDEAAMLTGSLGMLPSASIGAGGPGLYEPVHGSAPDIAGQGIANPIACILSFAMALRYSLNEGTAADALEAAVNQTLNDGIRTGDIWTDGCEKVSTSEMAAAVSERL